MAGRFDPGDGEVLESSGLEPAVVGGRRLDPAGSNGGLRLDPAGSRLWPRTRPGRMGGGVDWGEANPQWRKSIGPDLGRGLSALTSGSRRVRQGEVEVRSR